MAVYRVIEVIEHTHFVEALSENQARQFVTGDILEPFRSENYIKSITELVEAPDPFEDE